MHTLFSVHFPNGRVVTLDVDPLAIAFEDDLIVVDDKSGGRWRFERSHVMYTMESEVSEEQFVLLTEDAPTNPPTNPGNGRGARRTR